MANTIRITRSVSTNTPSSLAQGELAFSESGSPNGIGELFIGVAGPGVQKIASLTGASAAEPNSSSQDNQTIITEAGIEGAIGAGSSGNITIGLDYLDTDSFIRIAPNLEGTAIATGDTVLYSDVTDGDVKKGLVSDLPFSNNAGTVTGVTGGTGITSSGGAAPAISIDYLGTDNLIDAATDLESTAIATADTIMYHDATDNNVKKGLVSDLPFGSGSGDISRVDITTGVGLIGSLNTVSGDHIQTIDIDFSTLTDNTAALSAGAEVILQVGTVESRKAIGEIDVGIFDNQVTEYVTENQSLIVADFNWVLDEDAFGSNSAVHLATQQSIKAYVDNAVTGALTHKGAYNASTNSPVLDTGTPTLVLGDMYTVTVAGTFFTVALEIGDVLISDVDSTDAALVTDWTIVQANIGGATESVAGYIELATQAEMDTGTDDLRAVTALKYASSTIDGGTF